MNERSCSCFEENAEFVRGKAVCRVLQEEKSETAEMK
jgi:hypothetical protein